MILLLKVIKRNGQEVGFDKQKIIDAMTNAFMETEEGIDEDLIQDIADEIEEVLELEYYPTVESIQDMVEEALMDSDRKDVAKRYILYRDERSKLRNKGWEMNELQRDIWKHKYQFENETFDGFIERISGGNENIRKMMLNKSFLPAGRILANRKLQDYGRKVTYSNCYVLEPPTDSIEGIFDTAKELARTYSYGGGVGFSLNNLRPKGANVNNASDTTTGAVSFMELYSLVTGLIGMRGRRGALMLSLDVNHPDLEEFIDIKTDLEKVTKANISVMVNDEFMKAVKNREKYTLSFKVESTGEVVEKEIDAREVFNKLALNNWRVAEPGILYWSKIEDYHLMSEDQDFKYVGVNP